MAKLTLVDISSGYGGTTLYNSNNTLIEAALENTLSRDGTTPNSMSAQLDMNSNYIVNVLAPNSDLHVANKAYVDSLLSGTTDTGSAQLRVDLASTANTDGASLVGVEDAAANFTGGNVETILAEIIADYAATTATNGASKIGIQDSGTLYTATTVEAALAELKPNVGSVSLRGWADGAGAVDAITADFTDDVSLTDGIVVLIKAFGQITSTTPTFAPDGLTAKTIVKGANEALLLTDITGSSQTLILQYDSTLDKWILLNPRSYSVDRLSGTVVQSVYDMDGAVATGTTQMPLDDTIPQNTEGDQYQSLAITPTDATNLLKIEVVAFLASSVANLGIVGGLFQDATASAIAAASIISSHSLVIPDSLVFTHWMIAGTASATTFKLRVGSSGASTVTFNGVTGTRQLGDVMASSITITEYTV